MKAIFRLIFLGTPIRKQLIINCSANAFIRTREQRMTMDEHLFFRPPEIKFLGEFKGEILGQFEVSVYSSQKSGTLGSNVLSSFSGWIEEKSDDLITVYSAQRMTTIAKLGFSVSCVIHLVLLFRAVSQIILLDYTTFLFPIAIFCTFSIFLSIFFLQIRQHNRFFEHWFLYN